jgi:DNA-binding transcriptional LysR family regulator
MTQPPSRPLDIAALRTLVCAVELGSFARAAEAVHRTPGAVSLQMKALEERLGRALFEKAGRGVVPTDAGRLLIGHASALLERHDAALAAFDGLGVDGGVRFGMPQDFAESWLPTALARFSRAHPAVKIELKIDRNDALAGSVARGQLDLALAFFTEAASGALGGSGARKPRATAAPDTEMRLPMRWIAHRDLDLAPDEPVPLLLMEQPCVFHQAAIDALNRARRPWRIVLTSASVAGVWAAAEAGLGVTVRTDAAPLKTLRHVDRLWKLPRLPLATLRMLTPRAPPTPAVERLRSVMDELVHEHLAAHAAA